MMPEKDKKLGENERWRTINAVAYFDTKAEMLNFVETRIRFYDIPEQEVIITKTEKRKWKVCYKYKCEDKIRS